MNLFHIQDEGSVRTGFQFGAGTYAGCHLCTFHIEVQINLCAKQLVELDLRLDIKTYRSTFVAFFVDVFRTDTEDNGLAVVVAVDERLFLRIRNTHLAVTYS